MAFLKHLGTNAGTNNSIVVNGFPFHTNSRMSGAKNPTVAAGLAKQKD